MNPTVASYVEWQPVLSAEQVYQQTIGFSFLSGDENENLFWVENRPEEEGRSVLVQRQPDGKMRDVFEKPFSTRSRVFEYGGAPYTVLQGTAYFVNAKDQRIYKIKITNSTGTPSATPIAITVEQTKDGAIPKYMDLTVSPDGRWLVFAYEKEHSDKEAENYIGAVDLHTPELQEAVVLCQGDDFYKSPRFSPDGTRLAWLSWSHPYMPWDSTKLFEAEFDLSSGFINTNRTNIHLAGSDTRSISCFRYRNSGELIFSMDFAGHSEDEPTNFYNLYQYDNGNITALTAALMDFQYFEVHDESLVCVVYEKGLAKLVTFNLQSQSLQEIPTMLSQFSPPVPCADIFYLVGTSATAASALLQMQLDGRFEVLKKSSDLEISPNDISTAVPISFPTEDGEVSHGYFYQPVNSNYTAPVGEKPPVRVLVHGGPTGMTFPGFSKQLLFWTSQGYAVFDVNYRGSTGFGRKYRDALLQKWGILEIQDVKDGLTALRAEGQISAQAVVSGGSAGGYTVQRLLTFYPDLFAVGASHFGIGNLVTLQKLTHKYESRYLQQLIGGTLETNLKEYEARSPIHHLGKLKSPMIIFQGSDDKVVPPENSREMAQILQQKGIRHEYCEYPGEAHGFRKKENLIDALTKEAAFFRSVLAEKSKD